jgi:spermidine/putrescine ABC transporter ATP-binding subunit
MATDTAPVQETGTSAQAPDIRLAGVRKTYGDVNAVDGVDLEIRRGEFFTLLGPSGSGKTTCLRMIAGFERPDEGRIELGGEDVSRLPPAERDVNTVFQDYALFPHMSVGDNVAYGLKVKKVPKAERARRVEDALAMVRLEGYAKRRPSQLSGGQRQRVALARALVNRPRVLLLDEPLGALDLKLRQQLQVELKRIQSEVGITFVYVTHDQEEAMSMSDRIAVMSAGRIEQLDEPLAVYDRPSTAFVADFIGDMNFVEGTVTGCADGQFDADIGCGTVRGVGYAVTGTPVRIGLRPEKVVVESANGTPRPNAVTASLVTKMYLGDQVQLVAGLADGRQLIAREQRSLADAAVERLEPGDAVTVRWDATAPLLLGDRNDDPAAGGRENR